MNFNVGDRVAVYCANYAHIPVRVCGQIQSINRTTGVLFLVLNDGSQDFAHYKQCRKLKTKKYESIWIKTDGALSTLARKLQQDVQLARYFDFTEDSPNWVEFKPTGRKS